MVEDNGLRQALPAWYLGISDHKDPSRHGWTCVMGQIVHAGQRGRMLFSQHSLPRLHHLHKQLFGLRPLILIPVGRGQVGHASQRVWVLFSQHSLPRLRHLHLQLFGLYSNFHDETRTVEQVYVG